MHRRDFLKVAACAAVGLAATSLLPVNVGATARRRGLAIGTRTLDVNGKAATVYSLIGDDGKPGLTFGPGDDFTVALKNGLKEETIIHWHGLSPPFDQDGVADNPLPMLKSGEIRTFDFPLKEAGTYWMHAHTLQEQNLLAAPLIIRSAEDMKADMQEVVLLLHDFSFKSPQELMDGLTGGGHAAMHASGDMKGMGDMSMGGDMKAMPGMSGGMDLNDIEYDAYLANDRTLEDPEVVTVEKGGKVRLRIINGAASTAFFISTGKLTSTLIAVDGRPIRPINADALPLTMGQRIDLLVDIPKAGGAFPVVAQREGERQRTGVVLATAGAKVPKLSAMANTRAPALTLDLEAGLQALTPLPKAAVNKNWMVHLSGDMEPYRWGIMGDELAATGGERAELSIMNMSMMAHPMHLHGHAFQIVAIDGKRIAGALRDTVLVPPMKTVTIAFDTGKAGHWPLHCHHLYHMMTGMMGYLTVT